MPFLGLNCWKYGKCTICFMSQCKRIFGDIFFTSRTHFDHWKILDELWSKILFRFDNRWRISPYTPIVKIDRFRQHYDVAESGRFLQWGSMGEIFTRCRIWMKFRLRVRLKPSNTWGEFELDWARCYKNIAENPFALEHEMDSICWKEHIDQR